MYTKAQHFCKQSYYIIRKSRHPFKIIYYSLILLIISVIDECESSSNLMCTIFLHQNHFPTQFSTQDCNTVRCKSQTNIPKYNFHTKVCYVPCTSIRGLFTHHPQLHPPPPILQCHVCIWLFDCDCKILKSDQSKV